MPRGKIEITDENINYAEKILFGKTGVFDDERINFIKNINTIDLQAVPGSGKTTALLAKLISIERCLPLENDSGILVLSHTNTAVDEIKNKIGKHCPKLFTYPNFVGTIQSFVDKFLAIPFTTNYLKTEIRQIDDDLYQKLLWKKFQAIYWMDEFDKPGTFFYGKHIKMLESKFDRTKASEICKHMVENDVKSLFFDFSDEKIKTFKDGSTILKDVSNKKYQGIKKIIKEVIDDGIISYNYAYNFAGTFIKKYPAVRRLVRKRFKFVFIDEMQDMEKHQYDLLESLFECADVIYQRVGDKNQAIYSGNIGLENIWQDRPSVLPLKGSHRLSPQVAKIVNNFAIDRSLSIEGKNSSGISPHMIVFSENCIQDVIPKFFKLVKEKVPEDILLKNAYPIKVIGWKRDTNERGDLGIRSYCKDFKVDTPAKKTFLHNLRSYFKDSYVQTGSLSMVRSDLLDSFVMALRKEEIYQLNGGYLNAYSLCKYLRDCHKDFYKEFQLKIFCWSFDIYRGKIEEALVDMKCFIPNMMKLFNKEVIKSKEFINDNVIEGQPGFPEGQSLVKDNIYNCPNTGLKAEICTVHSAKGETHLATLYVETFYQKKYESEHLIDCFCSDDPNLSKQKDKDIHKKESIKVAYVALSRSANLLCFAIHKDRFNKMKDRIKDWEIVDLTNQQ